VDRLASSCGGHDESIESVLRFELQQPSTVTLNVTGAHLGVALALRSDSAQPETEAACVAGEEEARIGPLELQAGSWTAIVEVGAGSAELLLTVE